MRRRHYSRVGKAQRSGAGVGATTEERRPKRRQSARSERTLARTAAPTWSQASGAARLTRDGIAGAASKFARDRLCAEKMARGTSMRVRPAERQCSRARGKAGSGSSTKSQTANAFARPRTGARNDVCGNLAAQRKNLAHRSCVPARKNSFAYSVLRGRARFATASTRQRSAPAAKGNGKKDGKGSYMQ